MLRRLWNSSDEGATSYRDYRRFAHKFDDVSRKSGNKSWFTKIGVIESNVLETFRFQLVFLDNLFKYVKIHAHFLWFEFFAENIWKFYFVIIHSVKIMKIKKELESFVFPIIQSLSSASSLTCKYYCLQTRCNLIGNVILYLFLSICQKTPYCFEDFSYFVSTFMRVIYKYL